MKHNKRKGCASKNESGGVTLRGNQTVYFETIKEKLNYGQKESALAMARRN